eukprot:5959844-Alexandrium_andersonii.AAC.1
MCIRDRPRAVGPRGPDYWGRRVLRALAAAYGLDGAPQDPPAEVRPPHLPSPDRSTPSRSGRSTARHSRTKSR